MTADVQGLRLVLDRDQPSTPPGHMGTYLLGLLLSVFSAPELVFFLLFEAIIQSVASAASMVLIISIGGTAGSTAIYLAARLVGHERCLKAVKKHGRKVLLKPSDMETMNYVYRRWGCTIVFFGRWLPTFRSLVSIPAGLSGMPAWRFVALTFSGTLVWNFFLCIMLFAFRTSVDYLEAGLEGYSLAAFAAFLMLVVYFLVRRISERIIKGAGDWENDSGNR